jgi:hypothetical protein
MKWVMNHFIPLGGNPHRQMDLYPPLSRMKAHYGLRELQNLMK